MQSRPVRQMLIIHIFNSHTYGPFVRRSSVHAVHQGGDEDGETEARQKGRAHKDRIYDLSGAAGGRVSW